jgi:uncharacterized ferritin-like protein (DUF455 family)
MEFFSTLEQILTTSDPGEKIRQFNYFYHLYQNHQITYNHNFTPKVFTTPSFAEICKIVPATTLPKRGSLSTQKGKAYLVHSVLHIEYSAIDLALDHAYRFPNMPQSYYDDWLEVAEDEIRHFHMLEEILHTLGYHYGSFPVHSFLFDISQKSLDLLTRMAVVPRYLEASGLDSNPLVIEKLKRIGDEESQKIIAALEVILEEEIDHVRKGDRWFIWACEKENIPKENYFDIVEKILPGAKKRKAYVNVASRQKAGFSCDEIRVISSQPCQDKK